MSPQRIRRSRHGPYILLNRPIQIRQLCLECIDGTDETTPIGSVTEYGTAVSFVGHGVLEAVHQCGTTGHELVQFRRLAENVRFEDRVGATTLGEIRFQRLFTAVTDGDARNVDGVVAGGGFAQPFVAVGSVPFVLWE